MKILKIVPLLCIALTTLACSFTVNVPTTDTGVTQTFEISEPVLDNNGTNRISIEMGAGTLDISDGASALIEGTIQYNVANWEPTVKRSDDQIRLYQETSGNVGIPDGEIENEWDLQFGSAPIDLNLSTGAYEGNLDLSGLSITNLTVSDGASKATVSFDSLNPVVMERLTYKTGASDVELLGLGNANVQEVYFDSGVGSYTLDFAGEGTNDIYVRANTGMSDMTIVIPQTARAIVTIDGGINNVNANGTWSISDMVYECGSTGPLITINLDMGLGNLNLIYE